MRNYKKLFLITIGLMLIILLVSCSASITRNIDQAQVNDFYLKATAALPVYGEEPVSGELRPVPSSFKLEGGVLWISNPLFEFSDPLLPDDIYDEYKLSGYSWYADRVSAVRYIVLIDKYFAPSDEHGQGNSLIFTIVDLANNKQVYKSFIQGYEGFPYGELARFLEDLVK